MRTLLASLLALTTIVLLPFADLAVWVQRELVGTTPFVRLGEQVIDQQAVRDALADRIVTDLVRAAPGLAADAPALRPLIAAELRAPQLRPAFDDLLASTHDQLRNGHDPLQLDLRPLLPVVRAQLPPSLARRVPPAASFPPITVLRKSDAPAVWAGVHLVQRAALLIPILAALGLAATIAVARRRGLACVLLGVAVAVIGIGIIALVGPGRSVLEHHQGASLQRSAFLAGYDTVTRSFVVQTAAFAGVGGALVAAGGILAWRGTGQSRPRGWA
jgi:hypothetical protein